MFIKINQGLGGTSRNKKKRQNNKTKTKPNQKKKRKKSHTSKHMCTDINDGLREPKESGLTANIPSVPYFSGTFVKLRYSICLIIQMHDSV